MGQIEVISPGIFTSIQDAGRSGYGHLGVPKSGAMDQRSLRRANAILGNEARAPVLEMTFSGPKLKFTEATSIAVAGAKVDVFVNKELINVDAVIQVPKDGIVQFGKFDHGVRSYLAIAGGFQSQSLMGSQSWSRQLGSPFRLTKGMSLSYENASQKGHSAIPAEIDLHIDEFQVFTGPEFYWLNPEQQKQILEQRYRLLPSSDRMAFSFSSKPLLPFSEQEFLTAPVMPGVVQWYPNGQLVLLHRDAQRTGGYPRVLLFSEQALDGIAQLSIGEEFSIELLKYRNG